MAEEDIESLLHTAINVDQVIVSEVELVKSMVPRDLELAAALDSIIGRAIENATTLHKLRRALRRNGSSQPERIL